MKNLRIEALVLAAGLTLCGLFVNCGLSSMADRGRTESVRGLAERQVKADYVMWPIVYKTTGNDLQAVYADVNAANAKIVAFLKAGGMTDDEISCNAPQVIDLLADRYSDQGRIRERYNVTSTITVASGKVDTVNALMKRMGELLKQGVAIAASDYSTTTQYEFRGLNDIKPAMIEEATKKAREAAEKFADDSGSRLGNIQKATQGLFSIEDRDQYTPHIKTVRVVTMVDYALN